MCKNAPHEGQTCTVRPALRLTLQKTGRQTAPLILYCTQMSLPHSHTLRCIVSTSCFVANDTCSQKLTLGAEKTGRTALLPCMTHLAFSAISPDRGYPTPTSSPLPEAAPFLSRAALADSPQPCGWRRTRCAPKHRPLTAAASDNALPGSAQTRLSGIRGLSRPPCR